MSKVSSYRQQMAAVRVALRMALSLAAATCLGAGEATAKTIHIQMGSTRGGDGSAGSPFGSLREAEDASEPEDSIVIMPGDPGAVLDGGISLKPGQKLVGLKSAGAGAGRVRMTNTTGHLDGVIVMMSERNDIAGIHFEISRNSAIKASGTNFSGSHVFDNLFTGSEESEAVIPAILFEAQSGSIRDVSVTDCVIRDGEDLAGIHVRHSGDSFGDYEFGGNAFSDLGGRAYAIWSRGTSRIQTRILDSTADNIGRGNRNADSILPRLWGSSQQDMYVRNYRYNNTKQVGNRSNTGLEVFLMGEPFANEEEWCDGCEMTLEIVDSVFENTITDGIQLTNYGSNSVLDLRIRNTKVIGANPQQAGGALSLIAENAQNHGSRSKLLVENCDFIDSSKYGIVISDRGDGYTSIVDLGGGALGSKGNNRIVNSATGEIQVVKANPVAKYNWWGGKAPRVDMQGAGSSIHLKPSLKNNPGGG